MGEYWDEAQIAETGSEYLRNVSQLDFSSQAWSVNKEHPPVAKYLYGASKLVPKYITAVARIDSEYAVGKQLTFGRLVSAVLGSLTVVFLFLVGKTLYNPRVGLVGALFLSLLPHAIGHNRVVGLETPLSFFILLSLYLFLVKRTLLASAAFGLALATRFNAILMLPFFLLVPLVQGDPVKKAAKQLFFLVLVSFILLLVTWPWLWSNPLGNLIESLSMSTTHTDAEYFLGRLGNLPWFYYLLYTLATLPSILLIFLTASAVKLVKDRGKEDVILFSYLLLPFVASFLPLKQDGLRYIFQVLPALALVCAVGFDYLVKGIIRLSHLPSKIYSLSLGLVMVLLLTSFLRFNPYQIDFYNYMVGGTKYVYEYRLFEVGWWGEGIYEAMQWVNDNAKEGASINIAYSPQHVAPEPRKDLQIFAGDFGQDYILLNTYSQWYKEVGLSPDDYELVYSVEVAGAHLAEVYRRSY